MNWLAPDSLNRRYGVGCHVEDEVKDKIYSEVKLMRQGWSLSRAVDGTGPIICSKLARRCQSKHFGLQCRGVFGHKGDPHWAYSDAGWLTRWGVGRLVGGFAAEEIPPANKGYIHPLQMATKDFMRFGKNMVIQRDQLKPWRRKAERKII